MKQDVKIRKDNIKIRYFIMGCVNLAKFLYKIKVSLTCLSNFVK